MKPKKKLDNLVLHCTDSPWADVEEIRKWHTDPKSKGGRGWRDIGYNVVITNGFLKNSRDFDAHYDGGVQEGRAADLSAYVESDERGAHALGYNHNSLGVALVGREKFTLRQFQSLLALCVVYEAVNPGIKILGHCETGSPKSCPNFSMPLFRMLLGSRDFSKANVMMYLKYYMKD